jgi:hypothetical protein
MAWRIATHDTHPASIAEVYAMCWDDIAEAHTVLDAIDESRRRHRPEPPKG